jgi:hypothetical protein
MTKISYSRYCFPPEIIQQAIWLYLRFTLSFRDVEDLLAERGIMVSYETVRRHSDLSGAIFSTERSICGKSSRRVRCWATRIIQVRSRVSICAVREAIREAASPVRRATMPLGKSCVTSSARASPGFDRD